MLLLGLVLLVSVYFSGSGFGSGFGLGSVSVVLSFTLSFGLDPVPREFDVSSNALSGRAPIAFFVAMFQHGANTDVDTSYNCIDVVNDPLYPKLEPLCNVKDAYPCVFTPENDYC